MQLHHIGGSSSSHTLRHRTLPVGGTPHFGCVWSVRGQPLEGRNARLYQKSLQHSNVQSEPVLSVSVSSE